MSWLWALNTTLLLLYFWTWNSIPIPTSTRVARIVQIPSTVSFSQGMRVRLKALFWLVITPKHGPFNQYPLVFCSGSCYLDQGRLRSSSASFPVLTCLAAVSWWVDWRRDSPGNNGMSSFFLSLSRQPLILFLLCCLSVWSFQQGNWTPTWWLRDDVTHM